MVPHLGCPSNTGYLCGWLGSGCCNYLLVPVREVEGRIIFYGISWLHSTVWLTSCCQTKTILASILSIWKNPHELKLNESLHFLIHKPSFSTTEGYYLPKILFVFFVVDFCWQIFPEVSPQTKVLIFQLSRFKHPRGVFFFFRFQLLGYDGWDADSWLTFIGMFWWHFIISWHLVATVFGEAKNL